MSARTVSADRPFTGARMLAWMVGFFAVIFAANAVLIYYALTSFPGLEVASSYKAGQQYAAEVDAARAQTARHWSVDVKAMAADGGAAVTATFLGADGRPERGLTVTAEMQHPTASNHDRQIALAEVAGGSYAATVPEVGSGRWLLVLEASRDGERLFRSRNPVFLAP